MNRLVIFAVLLLNPVDQALIAQQQYPLEDTRHNLSVGGPGPVIPADEERLCLFCHTPYGNAPRAPLWGGEPLPRAVGINETATSLKRPDGASLVCLSCHDGTIALGDVFNTTTPASLEDDESTEPVRTDLFDGHPISFVYDKRLLLHNSELLDPALLPAQIGLDRNGKLQCTSCHDPHRDEYGEFLVMSNQSTALCITCHLKRGWEGSSHQSSLASWNHSGPDPWPFTNLGSTVMESGCENCHVPHTAGSGKGLLNYYIEEDNCRACHNGNVAGKDVMADFNKYSRHPIQQVDGEHSPSEPVVMESSNRHVECVDCHNPHTVRTSSSGRLSATLRNVPGIDINGGEMTEIQEDYELCFRCHGDGINKPPPPTPRQHDQNNVRLQFNPGNPSFHPVAGPGTNPDVPSLFAPMTESSTISCGDCHASNSAVQAGGQGANGPHGSIYASILVRQYQTQDGTPESPTAYALCYGCHDRNSIRSNQSFRHHDRHISNDRTPCNVCHDPHGISYTQGNSTENTHLINFDISIVFPNANGERRFEDRGSFRGACYLNCHNREHNGSAY